MPEVCIQCKPLCKFLKHRFPHSLHCHLFFRTLCCNDRGLLSPPWVNLYNSLLDLGCFEETKRFQMSSYRFNMFKTTWSSEQNLACLGHAGGYITTLSCGLCVWSLHKVTFCLTTHCKKLSGLSRSLLICFGIQGAREAILTLIPCRS